MKAAAVVRAALGTRFTVAVLRIERGGCVIHEEAFGTVDDAPGSTAVNVTTHFDLASLTKPFVASAVLRAVGAGLARLDAPLVDLVPEWRGTPHAPITLRMLLAHTSGMQSGADYRGLLGENVERFALRQPLDATPGERVIYSDLGFIVLGTILERLYGEALAGVTERECAAIGAAQTGFRPPAEVGPIPATEEDGWRGRVRGSVHDEKAHLMNGVAGHAGLFGTARDVAALTEAFLGPVSGRSGAGLGPSLVREAIAEQGADPILRRGLGWALKTTDQNSCGAVMSGTTFGHTGFTGTSVWADPQRDLQVVLLTNAVYFGRHDLRDVRAAACDAAAGESDRCALSA